MALLGYLFAGAVQNKRYTGRIGRMGCVVKSEYHLFLCDISGVHEPVACFRSDTPFPAFQEGQRFDDHGWDRLRSVGVIASEETPIRYTIHSIKHTIYVEEGTNVIQTWLNLKPYTNDRSPAFADTKPTMTAREAMSSLGNKGE